MRPTSFQDKVCTRGINSQVKKQGRPKIKIPYKNLDPVYKAEQQSDESSRRMMECVNERGKVGLYTSEGTIE